MDVIIMSGEVRSIARGAWQVEIYGKGYNTDSLSANKMNNEQGYNTSYKTGRF